MRKSQLQLIKQAKRHSFTEDQLKILSNEEFTIEALNYIYKLFVNITDFPCDTDLVCKFITNPQNICLLADGVSLSYKDLQVLPAEFFDAGYFLIDFYRHCTPGQSFVDVVKWYCEQKPDFCTAVTAMFLPKLISSSSFKDSDWYLDKTELFYLLRFSNLLIEQIYYNFPCELQKIASIVPYWYGSFNSEGFKEYSVWIYHQFISEKLQKHINKQALLRAGRTAEESVELYIKILKGEDVENRYEDFFKLFKDIPASSEADYFKSEEERKAFNYLFEQSSLSGAFDIESRKTILWIPDNIDSSIVKVSLYSSRQKRIYTGQYGKSVYNKYQKDAEFMICADGSVFESVHKKWYPAPVRNLFRNLLQYPEGEEILKAIMQISSIKESYVFKDLLSDYKECASLELEFPSLIWNKCIGYKNRNHLMRTLYKNADDVDFNRLGIFAGYAYLKTRPYVSENCQGFLRNLFYTKKLRGYKPVWFGNRRSAIASKTILSYYTGPLSPLDQKDFDEIKDYLKVSFDNKIPVNLRFRSLKKMQQKTFDIVAEAVNKNTAKIIIPKKSKFKALVTTLNTSEFEYINTRERLIAEGTLMHHCVASYAGAINRDNCAIYHLTFDKKPYTIEFCKNNQGYYISQLRGRYNENPPEKVYNYVESCIKDIEAA